tara:strand:- start:217 stop:603 length:387 start_codon:yes stop_codon:yes gene_type:complete
MSEDKTDNRHNLIEKLNNILVKNRLKVLMGGLNEIKRDIRKMIPDNIYISSVTMPRTHSLLDRIQNNNILLFSARTQEKIVNPQYIIDLIESVSNTHKHLKYDVIKEIIIKDIQENRADDDEIYLYSK